MDSLAAKLRCISALDHAAKTLFITSCCCCWACGLRSTLFVCHPTITPAACQTPQWRRLRGDAHHKQQQFPIYPSIHPPRAFLQITLIPQICWTYRESDDKACRLSRQLLLNRRQFVCVIAPPYVRPVSATSCDGLVWGSDDRKQ